MGLIPWSPLAGGLLGGALRKATEGRRASTGHQQQRIERDRSKLEAYETLCQEPERRTRRRGAGLVAAQPGRHRTDVGPAHHGTVDRQPACVEISLYRRRSNGSTKSGLGRGEAPNAHAVGE